MNPKVAKKSTKASISSNTTTSTDAALAARATPVSHEESVKLLDLVSTQLGASPSYTALERKRTLKMRKGGEKIVPVIAALCPQFGISVPSHPLDGMQANLDKYNSLVKVHGKVVTLLKHVEDTMFEASSLSWKTASVHYGLLNHLAKSDGDLALALAPVNDFFAKRHPLVIQAEAEKRGRRKGTKAPKKPKATATTGTKPAVIVTGPSNGAVVATGTTTSAPVVNGAH